MLRGLYVKIFFFCLADGALLPNLIRLINTLQSLQNVLPLTLLTTPWSSIPSSYSSLRIIKCNTCRLLSCSFVPPLVLRHSPDGSSSPSAPLFSANEQGNYDSPRPKGEGGAGEGEGEETTKTGGEEEETLPGLKSASPDSISSLLLSLTHSPTLN